MKKRTEATLWAAMACIAAVGGMWSYGEYRTFNDMGTNSANPLLAENVEALTGNETTTTWMARESRCMVYVGEGKKVQLSDGTRGYLRGDCVFQLAQWQLEYYKKNGV